MAVNAKRSAFYGGRAALVATDWDTARSHGIDLKILGIALPTHACPRSLAPGLISADFEPMITQAEFAAS